MWVAVKREGGSFRAACKVVPRLLLFMGWISFYNYFSGDPFAAFMESMVRCPIPEPIGPMGHQTCPKGASFFNGTCVPVGNRHKHWSLSAKCADKAFVMKKTASLNGMNQFVAAGLSLASVAVAGSIMDAFGRKPILVSALVVNVAVKLMLFGSCFLPWAGFAIVLMVQNVLMVMSMSPMYPAMNAMVADLTPDDESRRGTCYAAMEVVNHMMDVVAFLCGYPVLALHLADYRLFWGLLAVVGTLALVFFSVVLRETRTLGVASRCELPRTNTEESEKVVRMQTRVVTSRGCRIVFSGLGGGLCAVWNDGFLRQYFVIWAFVSVGINSTWGLAQMYAQSFLDLSPETASMSRALWHVSLTIGSMLSSPLIDRFGASDTLTLALFIMACGWGISGFESVVPVSADFLFWACSVGLGGIAYGIDRTHPYAKPRWHDDAKQQYHRQRSH
mmetsp:Transcript_130859/g.418766  ORF Transcript_130859/g.418766 Transcript_130859/m.418766 type:complete len:446 (-) Transcript_130859:434-1771(-)